MNTAKSLIPFDIKNEDKKELEMISECVSNAFKKIAPFWPLNKMVAVNPLKGFEDLTFEEALKEGVNYFQCENIPTPLEHINRETIKWCQAFLDEGQSIIQMPLRDQGLYQCFRQLVLYDKNITRDRNKDTFIRTLPPSPEQAIGICLNKLGVKREEYTDFLSVLLKTLPGWASYICYRSEWNKALQHANPVTQIEYIAMRIIITYLMWPQARDLCKWHKKMNYSLRKEYLPSMLTKIYRNECRYRNALLNAIKTTNSLIKQKEDNNKAQLVFCIDVRSEPFRGAIESQGDYETFGFAGFFGIPAQIKNELQETCHAHCPVLLSPKHLVKENIKESDALKNKIFQKKHRLNTIQQLYKMLKYTFTTPFTLVDVLGFFSGLCMLARTVAPIITTTYKNKYFGFAHENDLISPTLNDVGELRDMSFEDQCAYAENFLTIIGLTKNFAPFILLCGHAASTENNAYQSALDCGACGGQSGASNARILAIILNSQKVRKYLYARDIKIPHESYFIPALHNTTTDEVKLFIEDELSASSSIELLQQDLICARDKNHQYRAGKLSTKNNINHIQRRSSHWAETRPEWGLAKNAAFIVGPRKLTKHIDLDSRAFLHSYDWEQDHDGAALAAILTAPMVVAQWISSQYLFSTLDNVAYGSGSKITQNITGKIGIVQGNASDLMHGLPLQSVNKTDVEQYHEPLRLLNVVYAPRLRIETIIDKNEILKKLFRNSWVQLACFDPNDHQIYMLSPNLQWKLQSFSN